MKEIGFPISLKENEFRRALLPSDLARMRNPKLCWFETGYGAPLGLADADYTDAGGNIGSRREILGKDIICNPKALDPDMHEALGPERILFGWIHAVQGRQVTDTLVNLGMTAIAWEDMFEDGLHTFRRNNELAGEASVLDAVRFSGRAPSEWKVALLGTGNCGRGAKRVLEGLGASITVYHHGTMFGLAREVDQYDVVVNALCWDPFEKRLILAREDVQRMKTGAMIIDVSCDDEGMGIETTRPTTIADPAYVLEGVVHYAVDHTPAIFFRTATEAISNEVVRFLDDLIEGNRNDVLERATIIRDGKILDERISRFQGRPHAKAKPQPTP